MIEFVIAFCMRAEMFYTKYNHEPFANVIDESKRRVNLKQLMS